MHPQPSDGESSNANSASVVELALVSNPVADTGLAFPAALTAAPSQPRKLPHSPNGAALAIGSRGHTGDI